MLPPINLAIVGEPTKLQPAIAEKGLMVIDGYAYGKSGHAAREEGVNAIYEALDDLVWLRDYKFRKESPLLGQYQIQGFPTKVIVSAEGKIVRTVIGEDPQFYTFLDELLK